MTISNSQKEFLKNEFGLSRDMVITMNANDLSELREKCFDIEVEEAVLADNNDIDLSERGEIAVELVDSILDLMKSKKKEKAIA